MSISRVVYVTYDGLLEPLGASQVVPYVVGLARLGFSVEIISFEKPHEPSRAASLADRLAVEGIGWTPRVYHRRPPLLSKAFDILTGAGLVANRSMRHGAILVHSRSYIPAIMALPTKLWKGRLLLDSRGLWIDERVEKGHWREESLLVRCARFAERHIMAAADHFVHLTSRTDSALRRLVPDVQLAPFRVIPTCADLEAFKPPVDQAALRSQLGLQQGPILIHSGTLSGWYLSEMTFAVGAAFVRQTGGTFLVLTQETDLARELAARWCPGSIVRSAKPSEVPAWLQACDAGLALVKPTFAKSASCPTKVGEYLGVGMGVVATAGVGDIEAQFAGSEIAFAVGETASPEDVANKLTVAIAIPDRVEKARHLAKRYWSLETAVSEYSAVYHALGVSPMKA